MRQAVLVLASASPARLALLRAAGIEPTVVVSGVDESQVGELPPAELAQTLARLKVEAVLRRLAAPAADGWALGCDSVLELDGTAYGKPGTPQEATRRWQQQRGRAGILHTGHCLVDLARGTVSEATGSTVVHFADVSDEEIEAYVATGEPLQVAGAFTIDGLGGAFVTRIEGDHHNVVGLSLPLLRELFAVQGVSWAVVLGLPAGPAARPDQG